MTDITGYLEPSEANKRIGTILGLVEEAYAELAGSKEQIALADLWTAIRLLKQITEET